MDAVGQVGAEVAAAAAVVVDWQTAVEGLLAGPLALPGSCRCTSCWRGGGDRRS